MSTDSVAFATEMKIEIFATSFTAITDFKKPFEPEKLIMACFFFFF